MSNLTVLCITGIAGIAVVGIVYLFCSKKIRSVEIGDRNRYMKVYSY